jgi:exonuclease VII small subunit
MAATLSRDGLAGKEISALAKIEMTGRQESVCIFSMHRITLFPLSLAAMAMFALATPFALAGGPLETEMKTLKKVTKELAKLDGQYEKGADLVKQASDAIAKSRDRVPAVVGEIKDEAAQKAALEDYKKQMDALAKGYEAVGQACKDKDAAKLKEALEALDAMKKKGHEKFTKED